MSRSTPPAAALSNGPGGTKDQAHASGCHQLLHTLQGHVDEMRGLLQCGICIRPLYEPFTLACGHTFCYSCLTSWFSEGRKAKTCPDCRAPVRAQPAPAYLIRAVVQLFTGHAELLEKGETTDQHVAHQAEEAGRIEADKKNTDPKKGGIFKGIFSKLRAIHHEPIYDLEDNVFRCPHCSWELDDMNCVNCGYRADGDDVSDYDSEHSDLEIMTDDPYDGFDDEVENGFEEDAPAHVWDEWFNRAPAAVFPAPMQFPRPQIRNGQPTNPTPHTFYDPIRDSDTGSHDSVHDEDGEDDEDEMDDEEDEDMDSFIDDEEPSENYGSDSDRSTVVGNPDSPRAQLHAILNGGAGSFQRPWGVLTVPDSEDDEDEDEDEDEDTLGEDVSDEEDEDGEDEDEEPIRPAVAGNRRIPTYHILSSSSPLRVNGGTAISSTTPQSRPRTQPPPAGSSVNQAISLDDDSDEGPVAPTRRARDRSGFRPSSAL